MIGDVMRRAIYAVFVASVFTFVPIFILKLDSETAFANSLKWFAAILGVPGAFLGLLAAFGRVDDIDVWVTGMGNFTFYFLISWLMLRGLGRRHQTSETSK